VELKPGKGSPKADVMGADGNGNAGRERAGKNRSAVRGRRLEDTEGGLVNGQRKEGEIRKKTKASRVLYNRSGKKTKKIVMGFRKT